MYERFTDRARRAFQFANSEAQRFNHEYIGTEHILLGLVKEGGGIAAQLFKGMKLDLRTVRLEIEKRVQSGPEMMTMGKLPQTPRSKKVIEHAMQFARERNDNYVGTFHILVGLLREPEGIACEILKDFNVSEAILIDAEANYVKDRASEMVVGDLEVEKAMAISNQDFEKAAHIRDKIKDMKQQMQSEQPTMLDRVDELGEKLLAQESEKFDLILQNQDRIISLLNQLLKPDMERPPNCEHL